MDVLKAFIKVALKNDLAHCLEKKSDKSKYLEAKANLLKKHNITYFNAWEDSSNRNTINIVCKIDNKKLIFVYDKSKKEII